MDGHLGDVDGVANAHRIKQCIVISVIKSGSLFATDSRFLCVITLILQYIAVCNSVSLRVEIAP